MLPRGRTPGDHGWSGPCAPSMWTRPLSPGLLHTASRQLLVGEPGDECAQGLPVTRRFVTAVLASAQRLSGPSQPSRGVASLCVAVALAVDHPRGQRVCPGEDASGPGTTVALSAAELAPRRRQKLRAPSRAETQAASGKPEGALRTRLAAWGHVDITPTAWPSPGRGAASCRLVLGDDAPVAGPLAPAAHTPGAATCRSVARRRRPRLPEAERGVLAPRRSSQVPPDAPPGARASPLGVRAQSPRPPLPPHRLSVTARPRDDCWV